VMSLLDPLGATARPLGLERAVDPMLPTAAHIATRPLVDPSGQRRPKILIRPVSANLRRTWPLALLDAVEPSNKQDGRGRGE
jgi:hypothetical protein